MKFLMTYAQKPNQAPPTAEQMQKIGALVERNLKSGVLVMTGGLVRPTKGIQVRCEAGKFSYTDGPFAESKELIDGFALIQCASKEEALRHCAEFMEIAGDGVGEVLQVFDQADGPQS